MTYLKLEWILKFIIIPISSVSTTCHLFYNLYILRLLTELTLIEDN